MSEFAIRKKQLMEMVLIQDTLNKYQNKSWRSQLTPLDLTAAITVEVGELLEHLDYKWWGKPKVSYQQAKLEIVDIWHFLLSELYPDSRNDFSEILKGISKKPSKLEFEFNKQVTISKTLDFIKAYNARSDLLFYKFGELLEALNITFEELYRLYIGKSSLNLFRWSHGYKEGTYIKTWGSLEDNEHLTKILEDVSDEELSSELILQRLEAIYPLQSV
jgi:hypothetical protein